jgi:phage terminase large subunit GpA-like protein
MATKAPGVRAKTTPKAPRFAASDAGSDLLNTPQARRQLAQLGFEDRASAIVTDAWSRAWKPRERLSPDLWADRYFRLSDKAGASAGRWSTDLTPYLREILRCYADPTVRQITFMSGSQLGKTSAILICIGYTVDNDPQPTLFVMPDEKMVKSINKDRVLPTFRGTPALSRHLSGRAWDEKNTQINFDAMNLWYGWSGSRASMASRAIGRVFGDEIDEWKEPTESIDRARQRTKTFPDPKEVYTSTPTHEQVGIHHQFMLGDQREYWVPCPHAECGCYQTLKFERIKWPVPEGTLRVHADPAIAERGCWYECEACGKPIDHAEKPGMLALGVWARKGERVLKDGRIDGQAERPEWGHASFRLNSLYSPFPQMTWGRLARQFLEYQGHPPMAWINGELGEPVREQGESVDALTIIRKAEHDAPDYKLGEAPPGTQGLILTIDVQSSHVYYMVTGWAADPRGLGEWCALIDADMLECPEVPNIDALAESSAEDLVGNAWARVESQLSTSYPVLNAVDNRGNPLRKLPAVIGVDAGFRGEEVKRFARRHSLYIMFGRSRSQVRFPHEERLVDRLNNGTPLQGGVRQVVHNVDMFKDWAWRSMNLPSEAPGYLRLPTNLKSRSWVAEQMTAEHRVDQAGSRGMSRVWKTRKEGARNDMWDCLVMSFALADRYLLPELKARGAMGVGNQGSSGGRSPRRTISISV